MYSVRGNPPLLHLWDDVLQDVSVAMTSVLYLSNKEWGQPFQLDRYCLSLVGVKYKVHKIVGNLYLANF